ncbi:MAG: MFS transporter [Firmicutes bacterium]|nr:MFS transporter [Bacillota bacterium]
MKRILNIEYGSIHATYWMTYAIISSFASAFLLDRGYSNSDIGVILAAGSVVAVFLQPILADIADRSKKISLISLTQIITVVLMVLTFLSFVMHKANIALSVVFVMLVAWDTALHPLFNSLSFKLEESGHKIKFGINRAMGSRFYSILCSFLGTLTAKAGTQILPVTGEVVLAMLMITLIFVSKHFKKACAVRDAENAASMFADTDDKKADSQCEVAVCENDDINFGKFIKRNKLFVVASVGVAGLFFSNAVFNNFMLQMVENVGGDSGDMGRILSIMAMLEIPAMFLFDAIHSKISCKTLLKVGAVSFTLKIFCAYIADSVTMLYVAQLFQPTAFGIFLPAMVCFIDEIMEKGEAVKGQSLYTIMTTVGTIFATLLGGKILDMSGANMLLLVSTVITGIGAVMIICVVGRVKHKKI